MLASVITGSRALAFTGASSATKLKIMGVEIFSAGSIDESEAGVETVRYEDPSLGIYKKLLLKDNRLRGVILVGDTSDERRYTAWLREETDLSAQRRQLLFPEPVADPGLEVAAMPESEIICGCNGVSKGAIIGAIHEHGITTLSELRSRTRALEQLRKLHRAVRATAARGRSGFPGGDADHAVLLRSVLLRAASRHRQRAAVEIGAGSLERLRQPQRAARSASRRSATCWTCCGAGGTKRIAPRVSSTIAFTPISKRTEHFPWSRACAAA